jgi:hypothetical protein
VSVCLPLLRVAIRLASDLCLQALTAQFHKLGAERDITFIVRLTAFGIRLINVLNAKADIMFEVCTNAYVATFHIQSRIRSHSDCYR